MIRRGRFDGQQSRSIFDSVKGKRVTFCGIGGSNLPLISLFQEKGAVVSARDRRTREALGKTGDDLEARGVALHLGRHTCKTWMRTSSSARPA